jgi:glycine/D-amino acid oxidase-like deaminating enzyme
VEADLSSSGEGYRRLSLWWDGQPHPIGLRPPLPGDIEVDVAVVGGGLTGLWTAYYLSEAEPTLRIAVLEADAVGFGASGRNGGWCSALFAVPEERLAKVAGREAAAAMRQSMVATVGEVGRVAGSEGIECAFAPGGTVVLARTAVQLERARAEVAGARALGVDETSLRLLSAAEASAMVAATSVLGGTYTPHCATVDPVGLVRGLAEVVERRGIAIYEQTEVRAIRPGAAVTARGTVKAPTVVRATEGYTRTIEGEERTLVPVYSLMIATEPLPDDFWASAGLSRRETFADHRHLIIYGQRTADGRMAFGGRGAPYHFASAIRPEFERDTAVPPPPGGGAPGAAPATGSPRSESTKPPAWRGPAAMSVTACPPPTWPDGPCATSSCDGAPSSRCSRGSATARRSGNPSRSATSASTPGCAWPAAPIGPRRGRDVPPGTRGPSHG